MPKQTTLKAAALLVLALVLLASCTSATSTPSKDTAKLSLEELDVSDYFAGDSGLDPATRADSVSTLKELHERPLREVGPRAGAYRLIGIDPYDQCTRPPIFEFDVYDQHFSSRPASNTEDGALWVLEGWDHGKSRILQRLNPGYDDPVRRLGTLLMNELSFLLESKRCLLK